MIFNRSHVPQYRNIQISNDYEIYVSCVIWAYICIYLMCMCFPNKKKYLFRILVYDKSAVIVTISNRTNILGGP